ncbi:MAG: RNA polymerase factor sigma-54 [Lutibacter sp.]|jgi:RNA polymerase sigma-54 factor|nr:RNA polymerase factor sigma-54 [Lutibacter sp.]
MLKQGFQLKLSQKLSPQQIQLMKLIQLPTQAFEQRLKQELEENPALERGKENGDLAEDPYEEAPYEETEGDFIEASDINIDEYLTDDDIPSYKTLSNNYASEDDEKQVPYASGTSFTQHLKNQLHTYRLSDEEELIADFLVGSIDESGYLRRSIPDILDDLAFTQNVFSQDEEVARLLRLVQELDPPGVGARDLRECLLIQLKRKQETAGIKLAIQILEDAFEHFVKKHYTKLLQKFHIDEATLKAAISDIEKLNPKPGGSYVSQEKIVEQVVPDFTIRITDGELELGMNARNAPELHISASYNDMLRGYKDAKTKTKSQKEAVLFIKQKLDSAKWFIDAIKQRQQTLLLNMNAIMEYQQAYFLTGDERKLKPMILKDIADIIGMDVSTVSRVANSKYVATPYGTKLIKSFFSESVKNDQGEDVSTREIKTILAALIDKEDKKKPLTDDRLSVVLKEKGYPVARRTVAKYREQLGLSVARLRKEI